MGKAFSGRALRSLLALCLLDISPLRGSSSTVIDYLRYTVATHDQGSTALVYHYFDFRDPSKQSCQSLLLSLIKQLLDHCPTIPVALQRLYQNSLGQRSFSLANLQAILHDMLENFEHTYIVIDALDECANDQWDHTATFLSGFCGQNFRLGTHVLLTSRPEANIKHCLEGLGSSLLQIMLGSEGGITDDIQQYISSKIRGKNSQFKQWRSHQLDDIENHLLSSANGMYVLLPLFALISTDIQNHCS